MNAANNDPLSEEDRALASQNAGATDNSHVDDALRQAEQQAVVRAQQLEAIFEAMSDGIFVYDKNGRILQMNKAARDLLGLNAHSDYTSLSLAERGAMIMQSYVQGQSLPRTQWATTRILSGEVLTDATAVEFSTHSLQGKEMRINLSGAPVRDQEGRIVGAINICRDVTERWLLEQRTRQTLHALLAMAEALVQMPQDVSSLAVQTDTMDLSAPVVTHLIGQRLADLTRSVFGCRRVSLTALEPETGKLRPVAVVGLSSEEERQWMTEIGQYCLDDYLAPVLLVRLQAGEIVLNDLTWTTTSGAPTYGAREVLVAPMQFGAHLTGVLMLDYGGTVHTFTSEEVALADAVAKLATLAIERERLLQERAEACAREMALRETTQRMDEFLGIVAHELRTPLAGLKAFAQTLLVQTAQGKGPKLAAWQQKALDGLDLTTARLSELTDDLLDMARLQAGQLELHPEPTDLVPLIQRAVTRQQMTTEQHALSFLPPVEHLVVSVDPRRMEQVLSNLISNAIKYSPEGGPIEIALGEDVERQGVILSVRDHGIGISVQQQEQIFHRFVQADNGRAYGIEGTGLGLYLCRALVERHEGRIWFESIEEQGSTFFIALPILSHVASTRL